MATKYLSYEGLQKYHELITNYIDTADNKALKAAAVEDGYLLLYKTENPTAETQPDFRLYIGDQGGQSYEVITDEEIEELFGEQIPE